MLIVQLDLLNSSQPAEMDSLQKKKITSKISIIHQKINLIKESKCDTTERRALIGNLNRKKRRLQAKINRGLSHPAIQKVTWFY